MIPRVSQRDTIATAQKRRYTGISWEGGAFTRETLRLGVNRFIRKGCHGFRRVHACRP